MFIPRKALSLKVTLLSKPFAGLSALRMKHHRKSYHRASMNNLCTDSSLTMMPNF
jgi:hypothetical protein